MNESRNNSVQSTLVFICFAIFAILAIVLATEEPVVAPLAVTTLAATHLL